MTLSGSTAVLRLTGLEPGSEVVAEVVPGSCVDPLRPAIQTFSSGRADARGVLVATVHTHSTAHRVGRARVVVMTASRPAVPLGCTDVTDVAKTQSLSLFPQPGRKPAVTVQLRYDGTKRVWSAHLHGVNLVASDVLTVVATQGSCRELGPERASFGETTVTADRSVDTTLTAAMTSAPPRTGWSFLVRSGARPILCLDLEAGGGQASK